VHEGLIRLIHLPLKLIDLKLQWFFILAQLFNAGIFMIFTLVW